MGFLPGRKPPQKGETLPKDEELHSPEMDEMIKSISKEPPMPDFVVSDELDGNANDFNNNLDLKQVLEIPFNKRNSLEHSFIVETKYNGKLHDYIVDNEVKATEKQESKSDNVSTTYKGIKAIKRVTTEILMGNQVVKRDIEEKEVSSEITIY